MAVPASFRGRLRLPVLTAPMFLTSGPELVTAACQGGVVGTFPALNARTSAQFESWLQELTAATAENAAPFGVNLIVQDGNPRLQSDLALCVQYRVPLIVTSLGVDPALIAQVHSYGGLVFHDVINIRHARKAAEAGVDGIIAVCAGAGGHAGQLNPLAFLGELKSFYSGTVLLSGCVTHGNDIAAAQLLGADMVYMGTRFLATQESRVVTAHKQMVLDASADDILYTPHISGMHANFLRPSIEQAGLEPGQLAPAGFVASAGGHGQGDKKPGAWKTIWSAGQGAGTIQTLPAVSELIATLQDEYQQAVAAMQPLAADYLA
jgi:nitronate monooxygenase